MGDLFGGGGSKSTTSVSGGSAPWRPAQENLKLALKDSKQLYEDGKGFQPFTDSLVVDHSGRTRQGMQGVENSANLFGSDMAKPMGFTSGLFNTGGYNAPQQSAMGLMGGYAQGQGYNSQSQQGINSLQGLNNDLMANSGLSGLQQGAAAGYGALSAQGGLNNAQQGAMSGFQGLASDGGLNDAQRTAMEQTQNIAGGADVFGENPYFQKQLNRGIEDITTAANKQAAAAGRYNSGEHQGALFDSLGDYINDARSGEYVRQMGRMDNARGQAFGMGQQGVGNQSSAFNSMGNLGQQQFGNQMGLYGAQGSLGQTGIGNQSSSSQSLFGAGDTGYGNASNAANQYFNAGQTGISNLGNASSAMSGAYNSAQQPFRDMMGLGQMDEDHATRTLNDQLRIHNETQQEPWDRLLALNAVASGAGKTGSSGTQTTVAPHASPFQSALGGAVSGFGTTGNWGGALLGGLGGLFG